MTELKKTCYDWFNATSRKDWNDWSLYEASILWGETYEDDQGNFKSVFPLDASAQDIFDEMTAIIAEYDAINTED